MLLAGLMLGGCASNLAGTSHEAEPAVLEKIPGTDLLSVTLTEDAAERIGIKLATVRSRPPFSVPYRALLYDPNGGTWVYTTPEPLTYVRARVRVGAIDGKRMTLVRGPAPGTKIVTVGVAELYGAELGLGQE
jgi:hypothetical protein